MLTIPLNKKKIRLLVLGAISFVIIGFLFLLVPSIKESYNPLVAQITGYSSIVFFGICLLTGIGKLRDKSSGLDITDAGVLDTTGSISVGLIPWSTISFIRTAEAASAKFILIGVTNAAEIISRQNALNKFWLRLNDKTYKTPVIINAALLQIEFDELEKILTEKWNLYKGQPKEEKKSEAIEENISYKLYTTGWITASTYIGGPLAGFYLLSVNFKNLIKPQLAKSAIIKGVLISFVLSTSLLLVPQEIIDVVPKGILPILYSIFMGIYADIQQGTEIRIHIRNNGKKYSGWRAVGVGILCLALTLTYIFTLSYFLP